MIDLDAIGTVAGALAIGIAALLVAAIARIAYGLWGKQ